MRMVLKTGWGDKRASTGYIPGPESMDQTLKHVKRALEALESQEHELGTIVAWDHY